VSITSWCLCLICLWMWLISMQNEVWICYRGWKENNFGTSSQSPWSCIYSGEIIVIERARF
jgi:hypothetical protein